MKNAIVVGAGPTGLAVAAALMGKGLSVELLEKADRVGSSWRGHYDRLHLHTPAGRSALPGLDYPQSAGRYPSRKDVIAYLERYAEAFDIVPRFGVDVQSVEPLGEGWRVRHSQGASEADVVVFATGIADRAVMPEFDGLDQFAGEVLHSSVYKNPAQISGQRVLVIGFGNSGGEIALDLAEAGKTVTMAVRSPVQILPKELLGIPITQLGLLQKLFHYKTVDAINAPVLRLALGDYTKLGLLRAEKGPIAMIKEHGRIPLIDIGTLGAMREGKIRVVGGIERISAEEIRFDRGAPGAFDTIVMATGYEPGLKSILADMPELLDERGRPRVSGGPTAAKGLFFCSYIPTPNGQLRQSGIEAQAIAEAVAA